MREGAHPPSFNADAGDWDVQWNSKAPREIWAAVEGFTAGWKDAELTRAKG